MVSPIVVDQVVSDLIDFVGLLILFALVKIVTFVLELFGFGQVVVQVGTLEVYTD